MARFPAGASLMHRIYQIDLPDGATLLPAPLSAIHDYFAAQQQEGCIDGILFRSRVPPDLGFAREDLWGWCYLDNENPVSVGPWLVVGLRGWRKKVPPRLLAAVVEDHCAAWCAEHKRERVPHAVKVDLRDAAKLELLQHTPPDVGDVAVCIDIARRQLILPGITEMQGRGLSSRATVLLRQILHPEVQLQETTLESYLYESRPAATFPSGIGERFLAFLTAQAQCEAWAVFRGVPEHDEPVIFQITLNGDVSFRTDDEDTLRAQGAEAVRDALRWITDDEERVRVSQVALLLIEPEPSNRQFELRIDDEGTIRAARLVGGASYADSDLDTAVFERCETMTELAMYVRLLMHAFDAGPLESIMAGARQTQLWAGKVEPKVEWYDHLPSQAVLGVTAPLPGDQDERTRRRTSAYTRGTTLTADDDRAFEAHARRMRKTDTGLGLALQHAAAARDALLSKGGSVSITIDTDTGRKVLDKAAREIRPRCGKQDPKTGLKCDGPEGHKQKKHGCRDPEQPGQRITW